MNKPPRRSFSGERTGKETGLARALSKLGVCSRSQAWERILAGRVELNGKICRDPERRVSLEKDVIRLDAQPVKGADKVYLMLNKPRGLVTTASDEHGRPTVFSCLNDEQFPPLGAVGRLDKASEGLLLLTNDTLWAARITAPDSDLEKTYHVQVRGVIHPSAMDQIKRGVERDGEFLSSRRITVLRQGEKNSWLEIVLTEGKNRHIRRLLEAFGLEVLRLVRVAIGPLQLGSLGKGKFRHLTREEIASLAEVRPG